MKYFIQLSYEGSNYHGWQRQPASVSIQEILEDRSTRLLKERIIILGCGRTDAGVHAEKYFAHFNCDNPIPENFIFIINKTLPPAIAIQALFPVKNNIHAQHSAVLRTYAYKLHQIKNPFLQSYSVEFDLSILNFDLIESACVFIKNTSDFRSLCRTPNVYKNTRCEVKELKFIYDRDSQRLTFHITANRFLRAMVRLIIGNLLEVGRGSMPIDHFQNTIAKKKSFPYYNSAPARGLSLVDVIYEFDFPH